MECALKYEHLEYKGRKPEQDLLHRVLLEHLETFLDRTNTAEFVLPRHVEQELRDYLECGVLACGFVRIRCNDCGRSMAVAFSCKGRGFCPSCTGRRMADTSARLVDDVFPPEVPARQWVLSLPINVRYRLAYDGKLLSDVLSVFLRVVRGWYRKQGRGAGIKECVGGSVTFSQRFGSALNLNPHFHALLLDGVFNARTNVFHAAPPLRDADVKEIVEVTAHRVIRLLRKRGVLDDDAYDNFADDEPLLAGMTSASIMGLVSTGDRAGRRVRRVLSDPIDAVRTGPLCFASSGFSLHAATRIAGGDKAGLERLCKYVSRPPLAHGSLQQLSDEEYAFKLKTPWSDGTTHLILSPMELIEKLAALVPPPRVNLVRYHGILAPNAKNRDKIVPKKPDEEELRKSRGKSKNRLLWAALLKRTFGLNMEVCPHCSGRMRVVAAITDRASIRRYLDGVGLSSEVPEIKPARPPPQLDFDYADCQEF
jgi:Putative transposase/Transposase zinc-binding domain